MKTKTWRDCLIVIIIVELIQSIELAIKCLGLIIPHVWLSLFRWFFYPYPLPRGLFSLSSLLWRFFLFPNGSRLSDLKAPPIGYPTKTITF